MKKILLLVITHALAYQAQAHEVGHGGIEGLYDVKTAEAPLKKELTVLLKNSQLPISIKDPLSKELLQSPYLNADRDVKFVGSKHPGDWYIGPKDQLFYARTMPRFGSATTLFPIFYRLSQDQQIRILIHEAIHRLEFLAPNNISEDFVASTTNLLMDDFVAVQSNDKSKKEKSKLVLATWFRATTTRSDVPMNKMHWVGVIRLLWHQKINPKGGEYSISALSLNPIEPGIVNDDRRWYISVGSGRHSDIVNGIPFPTNITQKESNTPEDFIKDLKIKISVGGYLLIGKAPNHLGIIVGSVYDAKTKIYVGDFDLHPVHNGGTSPDASTIKEECLVEGQATNPPPLPSCYAPK